MVDAPESLGLALAIGAFKPRESKRARLECLIRERRQAGFDFWFVCLRGVSATLLVGRIQSV